MDIYNIVNKANESYIAPDGLMALHPKDFRPAFKTGLPDTVNCDNGILFLAYYVHLLIELGATTPAQARVTYKDTIESLFTNRGLLNRAPGRDDDLEGLDNYVAVCSLSYWAAEDIVWYGTKNGFIFDNVKQDVSNITRWRQGSDVCFYKMMAGYVPTPYEYLWFIGGIIQNSFQDPMFRTSETLLNWLRFQGIKTNWMRVDGVNLWYNLGIKVAQAFWKWQVKRKTPEKQGIKAVFKHYFSDPDGHPIALLADKLEE